MTQETPPGWYPDPGQTSDGPASERWWDGRAWTDRTRPVGPAAAWGPPVGPPTVDAAQQQTVFPGHIGYPGQPPQPPAAPRRGLRAGIAVTAAAVVLACIGVGVYALTDDEGGTDRAGTQQGQDRSGPPEGPFGDSGGSGGGRSPGPEESGPPKVEGGGTVSDVVNGISLPVPEGWTGEAFSVGAQLSSQDTYDCPGDTAKSCAKGGAYSAPAQVLRTKGSTPEQVAKADIAANAEESYGGTSYGGITSHEVLESKAVTVAGQKGYLVRWKAVTSKGADGYVQSLAFPSPADPDHLVLVRFGVDADQKVSVIDDITEGIEVSSGGGNGRSV
ncbi:membrane protein [Streptomyces sp. AS58]|uniref:DUF2510 domain-containing protein n=1 Tax=Streptomyces cadmiisoli TaxID=2184053 RepID=A0A2Z4IVA8_9ACTN|nr:MULTISPECIES: DUF2510 domain-containing protein [Streptomyces]AWW36714.1 DUF2510 domain-containing protein [Streptomyces cadmiisoli]KOV66560.1 membrane protein [Streptomyces sp. AS58]